MINKKNIVTIGGGTGSFTLLSGLKKYPVNISAIVSMADDGGSTGVLRDELGVLPPGDVRQCLVALSESTEILRKIMNYRFERGGLKGHSLGNLLLSALEKIMGDFALGVEEAAKILNVKGEVIPVTDEDIGLFVRLKNKKVLAGQFQLDHNEEIRRIGLEGIEIRPRVKAYKKAIDRIRKADHIIIGPGDYFGSILPNLIIPGISEAITRCKAKVVFVSNLTNKKGQTDGYDLDKYTEMIEKQIGKGRLDYVIFNNQIPKESLVRKYEKREGKGSMAILRDPKRARSFKIFSSDMLQREEIRGGLNDKISKSRSFIRHDPKKLAKAVMKLIASQQP